jgi:hypothetical protein
MLVTMKSADAEGGLSRARTLAVSRAAAAADAAAISAWLGGCSDSSMRENARDLNCRSRRSVDRPPIA